MHELVLLMTRLISGNNQNILSQTMAEVLMYAKNEKITSLETWLNLELYGYERDYIYDKRSFYNDFVFENNLSYRNTKFEAKQIFGLNIRTFFDYAPDEVVLFSGVIEIEKYINYNQPIIIKNGNSEPWVSEGYHTWAHIAHKITFQPKDLETTINKIKIEFINKLREFISEYKENNETNNPKSIVENIEHLIVKDEIENALALISENNPDIKNDAIMLLAKLSNIRKQLINITIKQDDYQIEVSKIRAAALHLLDTLRERN
jgi:hypothetical protein